MSRNFPSKAAQFVAVRAQDLARALPATSDDAELQARVGVFLQGLQQLNVRIDIRWATPDAEAVRRHAAELATLAPESALVFALVGAGNRGPMLRPALLANRRLCTAAGL